MRRERIHVPVMLEEIREVLAVKRGDVIADVTVGLGGHAVPLLKSAGKNGRLVGLDLDGENLASRSRRSPGPSCASTSST